MNKNKKKETIQEFVDNLTTIMDDTSEDALEAFLEYERKIEGYIDQYIKNMGLVYGKFWAGDNIWKTDYEVIKKLDPEDDDDYAEVMFKYVESLNKLALLRYNTFLIVKQTVDGNENLKEEQKLDYIVKSAEDTEYNTNEIIDVLKKISKRYVVPKKVCVMTELEKGKHIELLEKLITARGQMEEIKNSLKPIFKYKEKKEEELKEKKLKEEEKSKKTPKKSKVKKKEEKKQEKKNEK